MLNNMKFIDQDSLLELAVPAKNFSPEMLVVGKGHILNAQDIDPILELQQRVANLEEIVRKLENH